MTCLEEMHIRSLKVRSLAMATLLLDSLPSLKKVLSCSIRPYAHMFPPLLFPMCSQASNWVLDLYGDDLAAFKKHVKKYKQKGLQVVQVYPVL
jgi:hypothetical protein